MNQILEDMLRACALTCQRTWDKSLPYAEFSYNNSFQASLQMSPFEALYGRKCRTPLNWHEVGENQVFGPDTLEEADKQVKISRKGYGLPSLDKRTMLIDVDMIYLLRKVMRCT